MGDRSSHRVDVTVDQLSGDAHRVLADMRSRQPVAWVPQLDGWLTARRDLCVTVLRDDRTFTVDDPRFSTARVVGPSMLSLDGAEHRRHRDPFVGPLSAAAVRSHLQDVVVDEVRRLVAELAPRGTAELRTALAAPLAAATMRHLLDLHGVATEELLGWFQSIERSVDQITAGGGPTADGAAAFSELRIAVLENEHSSRLLGAAASGSLGPDELAANVAVMLFGGIVTTEATMATMLHCLLARPALLDAVRADRSLIPGVVDETLRFEPAAAVVDRYATRPAHLADVSIDRGDLVRVSLTAANRDPATFDDPDVFDPARPGLAKHLAFALGPHACPGTHVARLEAAECLAAVLDLLPGLRLAAKGTGVEGLVFRAPSSVHAVWEGGG
jgi:cytochrome P450